MDSYVSTELTSKLRNQQLGIRDALRLLVHGVDSSRDPEIAAQVRSVARLYRAHEALVVALLEAVEPDEPDEPETESER